MRFFSAFSVISVAVVSAKIAPYGDKEHRQLQDSSLVAIASATPDLSVLVTAVQLAGLVDILSGDGPFTVFAPLNRAFVDLQTVFPELGAAALTPPWNLHLVNLLLYHVAPGAITSSELMAKEYTMLNGERVNIDPSNVSITDATGGTSYVVTSNPDGLFDIEATNGVAHVIDRVLLPGWAGKSIVDVASAAGSFEILLALATRVNLAQILSGYGAGNVGYTLFAPTDSAFEGIDTMALSDDQILEILLYHVASEPAASSTFSSGVVDTLSGKQFLVSVGDSVTVGGAAVIAADILANNGIIHAIDKVILSPYFTLAPMGHTDLCVSQTSRSQPGSKLNLKPCDKSSVRQHYRLQDNMIHLEVGSDTKCLQAGLEGPVADGEYVRVQDCDPMNDLQKFEWTAGESSITLEIQPNLCMVNAGVTINNGDLLIFKECSFLTPERAIFVAMY